MELSSIHRQHQQPLLLMYTIVAMYSPICKRTMHRHAGIVKWRNQALATMAKRLQQQHVEEKQLLQKENDDVCIDTIMQTPRHRCFYLTSCGVKRARKKEHHHPTTTTTIAAIAVAEHAAIKKIMTIATTTTAHRKKVISLFIRMMSLWRVMIFLVLRQPILYYLLSIHGKLILLHHLLVHSHVNSCYLGLTKSLLPLHLKDPLTNGSNDAPMWTLVPCAQNIEQVENQHGKCVISSLS